MKKAKLFAVWTGAFFGLTMFTSATVGHFTDWGSAKAYAQTIESDKRFRNSRNFVEVNDNGRGGDSRLNDFRGDAKTKVICSVTPQQAAELDAFFNVKELNFEVGGRTVTVERVSGRHLTKHQLKEFLRASDASLDCKVIGRGHVFFLPLVPHIS